MNAAALEIIDLADLLRRPITDQKVRDLLGLRLADLERVGDFGYVLLKEHGFEIAFSDARRVIPADAITDPTLLHVCAFHLHREGHEGFAAYPGRLPNGVALGEPEWSVLRKMGEPTWSGGGGFDPTNGGMPYWIRYPMGDAALRFQSDADGHIEMVTLMIPDIRRTDVGASRRVVITSIPSRVSILWHREQSKGSPLTEQEVAQICQESAAVALPLMAAAAVEERRGYRDLDGGNCWEEWQKARLELIEHEESR